MTSIRHSASILILSLTAAAAGHALAAEPAGLTRAQVMAELSEAQRSGAIIDTRSSLPRNVLQPQQYPAQQSAAPKTRAQVLAELEQARANGELAEGEAGLRQNQLRPDLYPAQTQGQGLTSEQVYADMQRARDAGQLQYGESY
ncbi:DUF4148 domain-containing protein [Comamonas endophytica]|uniref:DUF4148 domain-containing protein n=1 Tax=Comamonas endophytica TaxID=2949090 RepID=A0ABY6G7Q5_9BURK|nr:MULTISPECIES: DUF4148 domain-containing protein [unclassified Acidovorax]MCD2511398.1 DUF4148 domain-containing protein [Acidovorax sp. D4N7]UYG50790.1 DUF4148 domain-containing protein [Acidovorax sp. 5MLIR]